MNKDNARLYLPLVQALADGKVIQWCNHKDDWIDTQSPAFADPPDRYRIRPEPREWWIVVFPGSQQTEKEAKELAPVTGGEAVHVREVIA